MSVNTPDTASQVEDRIKADVQREAPDSNPYVSVHWLRSLIAGIARRIFDFYLDLNRTEKRLFPDTADGETAPRWGGIYIGPLNPASISSGQLVATGSVGGAISVGTTLTAEGQEFKVTAGGTISAQSLSITSITRSGATATAVTATPHGLSSSVPVTISGAAQPEYNITDTAIVVTGLNSFTYQVTGSPVTPATGAILARFTAVNVDVDSVSFGAAANLAADSPTRLQSPIVDVDDALSVTFGAIGGGTDAETTGAYKTRYLDKIRNPVAHFNTSDIVARAKEVSGVTRVFPRRAGDSIGTVAVSQITRNVNVATVTTSTPHGLVDGQATTISGAVQPEYNVPGARIIVENPTVFIYTVFGSPVTPATGTITATTVVPPGQVVTYFMRDNDPNPIPATSEIQDVKDKLDETLPATTATHNNIVLAPTALTVNYVFTALAPNTPTMQAAVEANLDQFHEERVDVGVNIGEGAYRAAIQNTVDPDTGDVVDGFTLSAPIGDVAVASGEIAVRGSVAWP